MSKTSAEIERALRVALTRDPALVKKLLKDYKEPRRVDADALYAVVGRRAKERREELRLSQSLVAEFLGTRHTSIVNFEKGRQRLPLHKLYDLAAFLEIDVKVLLP